jgi:hypothetical protein
MSGVRPVLVMGLLTITIPSVHAAVVEEKYPDGTAKLTFKTNDKGEKDGAYEEFYPGGKPKVKSSYKSDQLDGSYKSFHENGKPHITATYKGGQLTGAYNEATDQGLKKIAANYKEGKLNGNFAEFDKGKAIRTQVYKDGQLAYPRGAEEIKRKLSEILNTPTKSGGDAESEAALRKLRAFRYLAEVPYEDVVLDADLAKSAQAAAGLCARLGKLDHNPPNAGLPEADYKLAATGAKNSNLAMGMKLLTNSVDLWVHDTDPNLGHRRSSLNPALLKTGFGKTGKFSAMWSMDASRKELPEYEFVAFPVRGFMPLEYFAAKDAWSFSLNLKKYKAPAEAAQLKVFAVDALLNKVGQALSLPSRSISGNCIIFRPEAPAVPARRYLVEIDGLALQDGTAERLSYYVEFLR